MHFLIVGLGSMGKRRVRNLQHLKAGKITGFDPREDRRKEAEERYGINTHGDFEEALGENPDVLIISTPPDLHMPYMKAAATANKHFFCEASVVDDGLDELIKLCESKNIIAAPSSTMRFNPSVKRIKKLVDEGSMGKPLALTYHSGQYLPDWHPYEDYRTFYVARRATGGCREIVPFELSWLTWVLGDVTTISSLKDRVSELEVDIDDTYQMILRFDEGVLGHLLVDVIARPAFRSFRLLGSDGVITWSWDDRQVRLYQAGTKEWTVFDEPEPPPEPGYIASEGMYIDEMRHLINAIEGNETYTYSLADDKRVLDTLYAAERSSDSGQHIRL
jgi:predicted dehydrogenase